LEALTISEPSSGVRCEIRSINILIRLLGAYHDGYLELRYENVRNFSVAGERTLHGISGHGDCLIDEITVADSGSVVHEILFRRGYRWKIESEEILADWQGS